MTTTKAPVGFTLIDSAFESGETWRFFGLYRGTDGHLYTLTDHGCQHTAPGENADEEDYEQCPSMLVATARAAQWGGLSTEGQGFDAASDFAMRVIRARVPAYIDPESTDAKSNA